MGDSIILREGVEKQVEIKKELGEYYVNKDNAVYPGNDAIQREIEGGEAQRRMDDECPTPVLSDDGQSNNNKADCTPPISTRRRLPMCQKCSVRATRKVQQQQIGKGNVYYCKRCDDHFKPTVILSPIQKQFSEAVQDENSPNGSTPKKHDEGAKITGENGSKIKGENGAKIKDENGAKSRQRCALAVVKEEDEKIRKKPKYDADEGEEEDAEEEEEKEEEERNSSKPAWSSRRKNKRVISNPNNSLVPTSSAGSSPNSFADSDTEEEEDPFDVNPGYPSYLESKCENGWRDFPDGGLQASHVIPTTMTVMAT